MMKKLSTAAGIAALSLTCIAAQAQVSPPSTDPSTSPATSGTGMPADITPSTPSPGMNAPATPSNTSNQPTYGPSSGATTTSPDYGRSGAMDASKPSSGSYGTPAPAAAPGTYNAPFTTSDMPSDPSAPKTREQVQAETLRAMRLGTIEQGEATGPEYEAQIDKARRFYMYRPGGQ